MKKIHITTGDPDGIGLEVSLKALSLLGPKKNIQFVLWRSATAKKEILQVVDKCFNRTRINKTKLIKGDYKKKENILLDLADSPSPTQWVVNAAKQCLKNKTNEALVTGPLSKTQMNQEGFEEKGHTDLLKKLSHTRYVFMTFMGKSFNVTLLTGHAPLRKVKWSKSSLNKCIELCLNLKPHLPPSHQNKKRIGLPGFNPHAGEEGLLGTEEFSLKANIKKWKEFVEGPLVPDVAFLTENQKKYFIYICLYHDQALIPFKMTHQRKSFQLSLGLPFIRTSVSHGTGKDIFGKNKADPQSMKEALLWAVRSLWKQREF